MVASEGLSGEVALVELSEVDWQIARSLGIRPEIPINDFIYRFQLRRMSNNKAKGVAEYYRVGRYSADLFKNELLPEILRIRGRLGYDKNPTTLLDFASGYGAVSRHFSQLLPEFTVTTCDIHREATRFNS